MMPEKLERQAPISGIGMRIIFKSLYMNKP